MRYKGLNFRANNRYVPMPYSWVKENKDKTNYQWFGKVVAENIYGAVKTDWSKEVFENGEFVQKNVFAIPLKEQEHSRTNMAFVKSQNGREIVLLVYKGYIYSASLKKNN